MSPILIAADLLAIALLVFGMFLPRHGRRDLVAAYLGVNVGVFAVAAALTASGVASAGVGLGLFGVLSIIRLRSEELTQTEIAYYFGALAIGLLAGLGADAVPMIGALMALVVVTLWIGDHPRIATRSVRQTLVLDRAHGDRSALHAHVERVLGGTVHEISVVKTDLVNDTTVVSVRHTPAPLVGHAGSARPASHDEHVR
ncbi:MAG: DUF4956 domain-containing protein [Actinomycetales bacterium]|jgi:hypothetical protein|uniref:DUF4956 domain-containing protein n=1 Tax=Candidatus Phosphoribacter hodrii TaxID=2953743 RepID=A0A935CDJ1_9MICO|nr:DUF4956 domain-containing protein [Candidatus Phosphoribacter hodrii]MBP8837350.1 DUF4956 domain-containing protein [Dermatophilaceae bacterium]OPZ55915.1 MAG: hypothetical protein BWY91_00722 [bacterium ADurb.BinA028]MBK7272839.1 DUF4956 domain-containing protein [Candidatus Phosphoribacter hodrii]MBL0004796.1 DUF4956 domain-containing protein [Candidatus Phosphoribacter hodrii]